MKNQNKIQALLINYLLKNGTINLQLPDGVALEIGCGKEMDEFDAENDYCWVSASRESRTANLDKYSMSLIFDTDDFCFVDECEGMVDVV